VWTIEIQSAIPHPLNGFLLYRESRTDHFLNVFGHIYSRDCLNYGSVAIAPTGSLAHVAHCVSAFVTHSSYLTPQLRLPK
jgi:hypothetical protein